MTEEIQVRKARKVEWSEEEICVNSREKAIEGKGRLLHQRQKDVNQPAFELRENVMEKGFQKVHVKPGKSKLKG